MVVITRIYRVVGIIWAHLTFQKTWRSVAPSTWAASTRVWSTLPRAETYRTMGWPTEVVNRIRMMHHRAVFSSPSQLMPFSRMPALVSAEFRMPV